MVTGQKGVLQGLRASDGRIKIATLAGVSALVVALAIMGVMPAFAGDGPQLGADVPPSEISYGGGSGACDANFPGLPSDGAHELWINNPVDGTFQGPDGTRVRIDVYSASGGTNYGTDTLFEFEFVSSPNPNMAAFDVVVNGGAKNTHYDYDNGATGPVKSDNDLHAPTKGGSSNLYKLSHINICYGTSVPNVSGLKFHDRDTDGSLDETKEEGLAGWTITAFDPDGVAVRHATTGSDGSYLISNLPALANGGMYTICEATNTANLPGDDPNGNYSWMWVQSAPANTDCGGYDGYEPGGYEIPGGDAPLTTGKNFGNHRQIYIDCSDSAVQIPLPAPGTDDNPDVAVSVPAGCTSELPDGTPGFLATFDVGRSDDTDLWDQFVIFSPVTPIGANPVEIELKIVWDAETAMYDLDGQLVVPSTKVVFDVNNPPPDPGDDAIYCDSAPGLPDTGTPTCLYSRNIAEGGDLPTDINGDRQIQVTDTLLFLGDPRSFR